MADTPCVHRTCGNKFSIKMLSALQVVNPVIFRKLRSKRVEFENGPEPISRILARSRSEVFVKALVSVMTSDDPDVLLFGKLSSLVFHLSEFVFYQSSIK